ncbi:C-terminal binding protein [Tenuibacillus multivorans]|uniref:D-3-phosphoglycerate dehydrogenase n=1 Tax=Tenuibacillus multivorans TaxID=237069 RepID=A0A1H0C1G6_9BACI|nr:C-terminal binding protein [Tenuibacillus multivorans]GEL77728.1 dehydrogenase [Tenuibacillus multivorans]SDN51666.1 D-3-phosphoglycerate dehydrogenase [Tenuibacillus multivorans]
MSQFNVVVTDYNYHTFEPEKEVLKQMGIELRLEQCRTEEDVMNKCQDADALLNQYAPISRRVIESLDNLKVISRYGVGFNTIDLDAATENGVVVGNVTDYCLDEVSDHAMALLLSSVRKITQLNQAVKSGNWDYKVAVPIYRLRGRTLGLVGFGNIPQTLTKKAQAFGLNVIAYDPFVPQSVAEEMAISLVSIDELYEQSDYVSVHLPLNDQTEKLISYAAFTKMKKDAFIINTSRGPVIDKQALIQALQKGEIAGAGLDVLEVEPIESGNPLLNMDQVILNPHSAFYSVESEVDLKRKAAQNIVDVLSGKLPNYIVNKAVKEKVKLK